MMFLRAKVRILLIGAATCMAMSEAAWANVDFELRPASQSVINNTAVDIEVYAVSDDLTDQDFGLVQFVFTWDSSALLLTGASFEPIWQFSGFPNDCPGGGDAINDPCGAVAGNDGDAQFLAITHNVVPLPAATPAGTLLTRLSFQAINTSTTATVALSTGILNTITRVLDRPPSQGAGINVTGVFLSSPATISIDCNLDTDCDDGNDCTADVCLNPALPTSTCTHSDLTSGATCGDPTNDQCNGFDTCDGAGSCQDNFAASGAMCGLQDDTDCDNPDTCDGAGSCQDNLESAGTTCGSNADTVCDDPDTCDAAGNCLTNPEPNTTMCGDQNDDECDNPNTCNGTGSCADNFEPSGTGCGDGTDTACLNPDTCNGTGTCQNNDVQCVLPNPFCVDDGKGLPLCVECLFGDNSPCNDGNACTDDFCTFGNSCFNSPDGKNGLVCNDGIWCNGPDTCQDADCLPQPGIVPPCDDENLCTEDFCMEAAQTCDHNNLTGNFDQDGLFCTGIDQCNNGVFVPGTAPDCDDPNPCTDDSCDDFIDMCVHVANTEECDDGDPCTGFIGIFQIADQCANSVCVPGPPHVGSGLVDLVWQPQSPSVLIGETIELGLIAKSTDGLTHDMVSVGVVLSWDPAELTFMGHINNSPFAWGGSLLPDDSMGDNLNGDFLDGDALYNAFSPLGDPLPPAAMATPTGLLITTFVFTANSASSNATVEILPCTGTLPTLSTVDGGSAQGGPIQNNYGSANILIAECFSAAMCDDTFFCNGLETCVNNLCVDGTPPCDDLKPCTDDSCSEVTLCTNTPNDLTDPDDGDFCNGVDTCLNGDVVIGAPPNCDDTNLCTDDVCDEGLRDCVSTNNTIPCDDQDPCTDNDACVNSVCAGVNNPFCVPCQNPAECEDNIPCTDNVCDMGLGVCQFPPNDSLCADDGFFCNGVEVCNAQMGCESSGPPCPDCDEVMGCACEAPLVEAVGSRYLKITPLPLDAVLPMGFKVTFCSGVVRWVGPLEFETTAIPFDIAPVPGTPSPDGTLGSLVDTRAEALFLTPSQWGVDLYVTDEDMIPSERPLFPPDILRNYDVQADCGGVAGPPSLTPPVTVTMPLFGDSNLNGVTNLVDANVVVKAFQGDFTPAGGTSIPQLDIHNCKPNQIMNLIDASWIVKIFQGESLADRCPNTIPCPGS